MKPGLAEIIALVIGIAGASVYHYNVTEYRLVKKHRAVQRLLTTEVNELTNELKAMKEKAARQQRVYDELDITLQRCRRNYAHCERLRYLDGSSW